MAGGSGFKPTLKNNQFGKSGVFGSNEVVKDQSGSNFQKVKFNGILGMGQTIDFNKNSYENNSTNWGKEFLSNVNYLKKEEAILFDSHEAELKNAIDELRQEIKKLIQSGDVLDHDIENLTVEQIDNISEYQVKFLQRIKTFIVNFRRNVDQAHIWCDSFNCKSKKKNSFWGKAKNKESGGEQYLFSGEHSASRSAN